MSNHIALPSLIVKAPLISCNAFRIAFKNLLITTRWIGINIKGLSNNKLQSVFLKSVNFVLFYLSKLSLKRGEMSNNKKHDIFPKMATALKKTEVLTPL